MALSLVISIFVLAAGAGVGRGLSKLWRKGDVSASEAAVVDTALGLGALSLGFFFLSAVQLLRPLLLLVVPLVLVINAVMVYREKKRM